MLEAIINYNYMQNALLSAILASIISGVIGTIIVEKQLVSMSGGISHASFGGIGAGYFLGIEPIIGGLFFAVFTALSVSQIKQKTKANADTIISMFWSGGMALGILFITLTPGYPPDMTSYLFGDILSVNDFYVNVMFVLTAIIVLIISFFFNYVQLYLFDEQYATIMKIKTIIIELVLYILIALSIVILTKVVGIILAIAILTIPPAIAKQYTKTLKSMMFWVIIIGILINMVGFTLSYYINIPSGATIVLFGIIFFFFSVLFKELLTTIENKKIKKT